jgi:hypothetical protein
MPRRVISTSSGWQRLAQSLGALQLVPSLLVLALSPDRFLCSDNGGSTVSLNHGRVLPPSVVKLAGLAPALSDEIVLAPSFWTPLSTKEVAAFGESRCPELEVLDLTGAGIELVGW